MRFLRIGTAGIHGKTATGLNPELAIRFASAFASYIEGGKVVIGRDSRSSSPMLYNASVSGLLSCGCHVFDAGIAPAPFVQFLVNRLSADGGVLIGAGHHPSDWNAIVVLGDNGAYLNSARTQEFLDIYHTGDYANKKWNETGKTSEVSETHENDYIKRISGIVDTDLIRASNFRIVADFCNGSGSRLSAKFAKNFNIDLISINDTFSGILPHDPEPRPRSSAQVRSLIRYLKDVDAGFVFNSDMSRAAIVTDTAETLSEEYTFPLVAEGVIKSEGTIVVTNTCTTRTLDEIVKKRNGIVVKTKVGQAYIIDKMHELGAKLAGDGSGSVAIDDGVPGFDSYLALIIILESIAKRKCRLSDFVSELPRYHIVKRKVDCPSSHAYTLIRAMKNKFSDAVLTEEDGFRFDWENGWIHLRAAMTEPIIRMIVEWKTKEEAEEMASQVGGMLET